MEKKVKKMDLHTETIHLQIFNSLTKFGGVVEVHKPGKVLLYLENSPNTHTDIPTTANSIYLRCGRSYKTNFKQLERYG